MKNREVFYQLEADYEPLLLTEQCSSKTHQIISFTYPFPPRSITIQYTEHTIFQHEIKTRKLMGAFFLESQPFRLFHFSQELFNNNLTKTELVPVDKLPCTALISYLEKSNSKLDLFLSDGDSIVYCWHRSDGVTKEAGSFYWVFYGITYWFDLENLTITCKTLLEKKQNKTLLLSQSEIQCRALDYVYKMRPSNNPRAIHCTSYQPDVPESRWSFLIDPHDEYDTYIRVFLNQRGVVLGHYVE